MGDSGVAIPNLLCFNDHGASGQVMVSADDGYVCPQCRRRADVEIEWEDADE